MLNETVMEHLRRSVSAECIDAYFSGMDVRVAEDGVACVVTPTRHARESIEKLYKREVLDAIRSVHPEVVEVQFCTAQRLQQNSNPFPFVGLFSGASAGSNASTPSNAAHNGRVQGRSGQHAGGMRRGGAEALLNFELPLSSAFKLAHFEHGICNKIACAAAHTVVENPGTVYSSLFLFGPHGLGKTHLLQGIALGLQERDPNARIVYTSCEVFANAYIAALQTRGIESFRARLRSCDALLVDGVQFLAGKAKTQEELLHTAEYLRSMGKQVVFSSTVSPGELSKLNPKLYETIRSGLVVRLETPEFELRVTLLHALAKRRNWTIDDGAARVIATHVEKSIGELDGAMCKMVAVARATDLATSAQLALEALRDLGYLHSGPLKLEDILHASAKFYKIESDDIRSDKRNGEIVHARHVAMHLARHLTSITNSEIGRYFGNRDHSTVLHAIRKVNSLVKREEPVRLELQKIRQVLGR